MTAPEPIPLHRPMLGEAEREAVTRCLAEGQLDGDGPRGRAIEARLASITGSRHVLLTTSATAALELALQLLDLGPGDEVVCPSFAFPSSANAILRCGATPVFADVHAEHLCLDPDDVARVTTAATRAVLPVDYGGVGCDPVALRDACGRDDILLVQDAAHGIGARRHGRHVGLDADATALSFHVTKNVTCGEGGALLLQRDELASRAEVLREKGTNRAAFLRGEVPRYEWVDVGTSGAPSDLLAALLDAQLDRLDDWTALRRSQVRAYDEALTPHFEAGRLVPQRVPPGCEPNGHLYVIRTRDGVARRALAAHLSAAGIEAPIHFVPLHSTAFAARRLGPQRPLPVTDLVGETLLRLPIGPHLRPGDQQRVIDELQRALARG